jgi:hypothetical protein
MNKNDVKSFVKSPSREHLAAFFDGTSMFRISWPAGDVHTLLKDQIKKILKKKEIGDDDLKIFRELILNNPSLLTAEGFPLSESSELKESDKLSLVDVLITKVLAGQAEKRPLSNDTHAKLMDVVIKNGIDVLCCNAPKNLFELEFKRGVVPRALYIMCLEGDGSEKIKEDLVKSLMKCAKKEQKNVIDLLVFKGKNDEILNPHCRLIDHDLQKLGLIFLDLYIDIVFNDLNDFLNKKDEERDSDTNKFLTGCLNDITKILDIKIKHQHLYDGKAESVSCSMKLSAIAAKMIGKISQTSSMTGKSVNHNKDSDDPLQSLLNVLAGKVEGYTKKFIKFYQDCNEKHEKVMSDQFKLIQKCFKKIGALQEKIKIKDAVSRNRIDDDLSFEDKLTKHDKHYKAKVKELENACDEIAKKYKESQKQYYEILTGNDQAIQGLKLEHAVFKSKNTAETLRLGSENSELQKQIKSLKEEIPRLTKKYNDQMLNFQQRNEELKTQIELTEKTESIEEKLKNDIARIKEKNAGKNRSMLDKIGSLEADNQSLRSKYKDQEICIKSLQKENAGLSQKNASLQQLFADKNTRNSAYEKQIKALLKENEKLKLDAEKNKYAPYCVTKKGVYTVPALDNEGMKTIFDLIFSVLGKARCSLFIYGSSIKGSPYWSHDHSDIDVALLTEDGDFYSFLNDKLSELKTSIKIELNDDYRQITFTCSDQNVDLTFKEGKDHTLISTLNASLLDPLYIELKKHDGGYTTGKTYHADWKDGEVKFNGNASLFFSKVGEQDWEKFRTLTYLCKNYKRIITNRFDCPDIYGAIILQSENINFNWLIRQGHQTSKYFKKRAWPNEKEESGAGFFKVKSTQSPCLNQCLKFLLGHVQSGNEGVHTVIARKLSSPGPGPG